METTKQRRIQIDYVLIGIALLAGFLNIYRIWLNETGNAYYTAAVTSMLQNFHAFFYASLDSAGFVTVDKPPVTFWVQTVFAYFLGVRGWSVILPQALAGIGSVLLMYNLMKPTFGRTSARLAALVMAVTPIAVAVARTNNVDALLVFTLLLAAWMLLKAVRGSSRTWMWTLGAFAMIGVAFNEKMLEAYMILPAFYLFYWIAFQAKWKKKLVLLSAATAVLAVVSLSWPLTVDLTSTDSRPYIGSSQTNSVLELAFGYNGVSRLTGQGNGVPGSGGGGSMRDGSSSRSDQGMTGAMNQSGSASTDGSGSNRPSGTNAQSTSNSQSGSNNQDGTLNGPANGTAATTGTAVPDDNGTLPSPPNGNMGGQGGGGGDFGGGGPGGQSGFGGGSRGGAGGGNGFNLGTAGPLRLFQSELSGQISWLIPFAAFAAIGLLSGIRRRKAVTAKQKETVFWLAWLIPLMGFFSVAGFFHQYYLIMLAPAIAALVGAGWAELYSLHRAGKGWQTWLLPAAITATAAFQLYILHPYLSQIGKGWSVAVGTGAIAVVLVLTAPIVKARLTKYASGFGLLVLLVAPTYWSATPFLYGDNSHLPVAGPDIQQSSGNSGGSASSIDASLLSYLTANNSGETYLFATTNVGTAESYILATGGKAVMAMGGYSGSDPILTVDRLKTLVSEHQVKYFLISPGGRGGSSSSEVISWIEQNGKQISQSEWQGGTADTTQSGNPSQGGGMGSSGTLYEVTF